MLMPRQDWPNGFLERLVFFLKRRDKIYILGSMILIFSHCRRVHSLKIIDFEALESEFSMLVSIYSQFAFDKYLLKDSPKIRSTASRSLTSKGCSTSCFNLCGSASSLAVMTQCST